MAEMIPETIPSKASAGEKRLFAVLERLPSDCVVYYEPRVNLINPDFIVIVPRLGVLIMEVKGWYAPWIARGDSNEIIIRKDGHEESQQHPTRQANGYKYALMKHCKSHAAIAGELFDPASGRLAFPVCHCCVLSNISERALEEINGRMIFPKEDCASRDDLLRWDEILDGTDLLKALQPYFRPVFSFAPLIDQRLKRLRALIHPEIVIRQPSDYHDLAVLDLQQERHARSIGDGHRIVFGIAGSGKTVLLIARAKLLSQQNPTSRILVLCYNVTLRAYLSVHFSGYPNVNVQNFHKWAIKAWKDNEKDATTFGERWLDLLQRRATPEAGRYDAILIDEAQDFAPVWFRCVVAALKHPQESDLLIVHDGSQGLYGDHGVRWKEVGVQAQGRSTRNDLAQNYRNTREVLRLAQRFSKGTKDGLDPDSADHVVPVNAGVVQRSFHAPLLLKFHNRDEEIRSVHEIVRQLTTGNFAPLPGYKVAPAEIAVLYRVKPYVAAFQSLVADPSITWLTRDDDRNARTRVKDENTKVLTINAAKGLQFRVVIVMCCDEMPLKNGSADATVERSYQYVALTRAEELLIMTHSRHSGFTLEVAESQLADQIDWEYGRSGG